MAYSALSSSNLAGSTNSTYTSDGMTSVSYASRIASTRIAAKYGRRLSSISINLDRGTERRMVRTTSNRLKGDASRLARQGYKSIPATMRFTIAHIRCAIFSPTVERRDMA